MKGWQIGLLVVFTLGIGYVLLRRPSVNGPVTTTQSTSNALLNLVPSVLNLGGKLIGSKPSPPSATMVTGPIINEGTYHSDTSDLEQQGNQLVNSDTGQAVTYGTD